MNRTITKKTNTNHAQICECALTGTIFDGRFSPLKLIIIDEKLQLSLSDKAEKDAIFLDIDPKLIASILSAKRSLPDAFQKLLPDDFGDQIKVLYHKKIFETLGFLLKSGQAIVGRRAIDRAMTLGNKDRFPMAVLKTPEGSDTICEGFKFKRKGLKIITLDSDVMLKKVTAREKISYCCILDSQMGTSFVNDYLKYLQFIGH